MNPALAVALGLIALFGSSLLGMILYVLTGIRDEIRDHKRDLAMLIRRVAEHEGYFAALKMQHTNGGKL